MIKCDNMKVNDRMWNIISLCNKIEYYAESNLEWLIMKTMRKNAQSSSSS